jgi:hypothetical protein
MMSVDPQVLQDVLAPGSVTPYVRASSEEGDHAHVFVKKPAGGAPKSTSYHSDFVFSLSETHFFF